MIFTRQALERLEKKRLAPYAVWSRKSKGREYEEVEDPYRTCFQRDRDRIIHSKAFRRLSGKTQVFVAMYGDHYRDRLSHTLEITQVARDLARTLALNEDLAEAIALAHDLGHTPFGHAGEDALNEIMQRFDKHFEHNEQSKRIVEKLEKRYPHFDGLNLTYEVRQGLAKHQTIYDQRGQKISGKTLEAQVVDLADEIAYHNHDLDDGIRSGLFRIQELSKLRLWKEALKKVKQKYGNGVSLLIMRHRCVSMMISLMIHNVVQHTEYQLKRYHIRTLQDVFHHPKNIVGFSPSFQKKVTEVRVFLWERMYQAWAVKQHSNRGKRIMEKLFWTFYEKPKLLPQKFQKRMNEGEPREVLVKDYIAGMTDAFAIMKTGNL